MSRQYLMIRAQFLREESYQLLKRNSLGLNSKYSELCELFERHYRILQGSKTEPISRKRQTQMGEKQQQYEFIAELDRFVVDFTNIIAEVSNFQIECLQNLRHSNKSQLDVLNILNAKVKENRTLNTEIELKKNALTNLYLQIKAHFATYRKDIQKPINYYDKFHVNGENQKLDDKIRQAEELMSGILTKKTVIQTKLEQFEPYLTKFKCKLVKNKYSVLRKVGQLIQNSKYCQIEMIGLIRQCAINRKSEFRRIMENHNDDISYLKELLNRTASEDEFEHHTEENMRWEKNIKLSLAEFQREAEAIEIIFYNLLAYFNYICNNFSTQHEEFKTIIFQISDYYDEKESPEQEMKQLFDLHEQLHKKFNHIIDRTKEIIKNIEAIKNSGKKHAEIILSLLRVKKAGNHGGKDGNSLRNDNLVELMSQISFSSIKESILSFYDCCILTQNELLDAFNTAKPRRKTNDSMQISHSASQHKFMVDRKTPLKQEVWLWRDWKYEIQVNFQGYQEYFDEITKLKQKTHASVNTKETTELQNYSCSLLATRSLGTLRLRISSLQFTSDSKNLSISWKDVNNINIANNFFQKILSIQTTNGVIDFTGFVDVQSVATSAKEIQEKSMTSGQKKFEKKKQVQLTPQDLKIIEERKIKIKDELPKTDGYKFIVEEVFEGETIDQMYELIYSDKPFAFYGREEPCFFSYTGKKAGNINWVAQKFDKPGPEFYSLVAGVNFSNCPVSSTRIITYNHPMKDTGIPFMPKFCGNKDQRKIYWVSHEQIQYLIRSQTDGIPYADYFYVNLLHKVTKVENGVKIEIYFQVNFVKETSLKNIILKSTDPEIEANMIEFMKEIKKLMKLRKDIEKGEAVVMEPQQPPPQRNLASPPDQISQLKFYNKILLAGLAFLVVVNILHAVIF